jgi:hypothetical protein
VHVQVHVHVLGKLVACGSIPTYVHHEHGDRLAATGGNPGFPLKQN